MISEEEKEESLMELLLKGRNYKNLDEVKDCCINILTEGTQYNFCFIEFETPNYLGVFCTHSDFTERFALIAKKYIVSISVVYQQDLSVEEPNVSEYI